MDKFRKLFEIDKTILNMYGKIITAKRIGTILKSKNCRTNNAILRERRQTNECFVIGLGPSLKKIDLSKLDADTIVTNRYYLVNGAEATKPYIYVLCDNDFFGGKSKDDFKSALKMFPNTLFFVNGLYKKQIQASYPNNDNILFGYFWDGCVSENEKYIDCTKILPMALNVVLGAIYTALYAGYKEIYLLGCDFNGFAFQTKAHAYKDDDSNRLWTMSQELFGSSIVADLHCQLDKYSRKHGQRIYNMTEGSLIDAYERKSCDVYKKVETV